MQRLHALPFHLIRASSPTRTDHAQRAHQHRQQHQRRPRQRGNDKEVIPRTNRTIAASTYISMPVIDASQSSSKPPKHDRFRPRASPAPRGARDARESIVGSFEVLIARTGHRTNEIMKILTLTSVILHQARYSPG